MSHRILTEKLCELERKIAGLQSRIRLSEEATGSQIRAEIKELRMEYAEDKQILQNNLRYSRTELVGILASVYNEIEPIIQQAQEAIMTKSANSEDEELATENKLLLAEYELDFSVLAIERALLVSLDAIAARITASEEETTL